MNEAGLTLAICERLGLAGSDIAVTDRSLRYVSEPEYTTN
jgi:hypothetical protein